MVDYTIAAQTPQASQAVNPMQTMTQYQGLANAMLQNQQAQRQMQQQNALTDILGRSGGVFSPQVYKDLVASGNVDAALKMQHQAASLGSIGVHTAAAQTALEKARLELTDTKRQLAAGAASRDFIAQNDDLTNPDALKKLRKTNSDAYEAVVKFNGLTAKMGYEASTAKRLDDKAKLDLAQGTMALFAPAFATAKTEDQFFKLYDQLASKYEAIGTIAPREFTPDAVRSLVQAGSNLQDLEAITVGNRPAIRNKRTGQVHLSEVGELGANAVPSQRADIAPPVAPVANGLPPAGAPTSPMAPTVANALTQGLPGAAPAAPAANAMAAPTANALLPQPAASQNMTQLLAAEDARKARQAGLEAGAREEGQTAVRKTTEEADKKRNAKQVLALVSDPELENLVKKSTSGLAQTAGALAKGALPGGEATPGMTNINRLQTFQSKILMDFVNGKLGAGFSNEDRELVNRMIGDIANPLKPANARLETLRDLKSMLESAATGEPMKIRPAAEPKSEVPQGRAARGARAETSNTSTQPTLEQFLAKARPANPNASVEDLTSYYNRTYGGR